MVRVLFPVALLLVPKKTKQTNKQQNPPKTRSSEARPSFLPGQMAGPEKCHRWNSWHVHNVRWVLGEMYIFWPISHSPYFPIFATDLLVICQIAVSRNSIRIADAFNVFRNANLGSACLWLPFKPFHPHRIPTCPCLVSGCHYYGFLGPCLSLLLSQPQRT